MSLHADPGNDGRETCNPPLDIVILPRATDIGGFEVRRALPAAQRRMVGPFIFFDQMGPSTLARGHGIDVRPHPHINLATVTYLFDGEILHRDSLGSTQPIRPGEVNWMIAGHGIAHSERTPETVRAKGSVLFGLQTWIALPVSAEENPPSFAHYGAAMLPEIRDNGAQVRLIAGNLYGHKSPVRTSSEMFYAHVDLAAGKTLPLDAYYEERAVYTVSGDIEIGEQVFGAARLLVFRPGDRVTIRARRAARFMLLGGAPMDGPRYIWWNFVSSSKERIRQAAEDWKAGRFGKIPGDDSEFIPLPENGPVALYP